MRTGISAMAGRNRYQAPAAAHAAKHSIIRQRIAPADIDDLGMFSARFDEADDLDKTLRGFRDACEAQAADDRYD